MEIIDSYLNYKKQSPKYKPWKEEREAQEAKRLSYVQNNDIPQAQKDQDVQRAKAVLRAVDVMDEYSQSKAEDMEIVTQSAIQGASSLTSIPGAIIGLILALKSPKLQERLGDEVIGIAPMIGAMLSMTISYPFLAQWGARKEIEASQNGRFEAMQKNLSNAKQFAILDENQEKQVEEIAKTIKIPKKEMKKAQRPRGGIFSAMGSLFKDSDNKTKTAKQEFKQKLKHDAAQLDKLQLNEQEIEEAKKDKQLIQNVVEKIDIASQDYAENIELATSAVSLLGAGSSALIGALANKLLSYTKMAPTKRGIFSVVLGGAGVLASTIYAAKLQKQASRVARFKVKQDFLNNPDKLVYVDDEKLKDIKAEPVQKEEKKNFFQFLGKIIKDNKEYNNYLKNENIAQKQKIKALDQIEITPEQEKRARQLQHNTFKMFNKLDEKSQKYSENAEALGETVQVFGSTAASLFMLTGMGQAAKNLLKIDESSVKNAADGAKTMVQAMWPMYKKLLIGFVPLMALNAFVTKEQKGASRIANMEAIKEMEDYRNFADTTSQKSENAKQNEPKPAQQNKNEQNKKDLFSAFKK